MSEIAVADLRPSKDVQEFENFVPLLDRVLIERVASDAYVADMFIPDKYREPESMGVVVALGEGVVLGREFFPLTKFLQVGDVVMFGSHTVEKIKIGEKEFEIARIQDIRGKRRAKHV